MGQRMRFPRLEEAAREYGMTPRAALLYVLNDAPTVTAAAQRLGVRKQALYRWIEAFHVRVRVRYECVAGVDDAPRVAGARGRVPNRRRA